ncbi:MAG: electron transfer flavoprotein subunit alpha/FixB family protein [Deltaproteobacteria bacterium]|nr:electron transfer flavoprotein subunit alpha/FixB family protein [Deltaproteobacteria bacterium]
MAQVFAYIEHKDGVLSDTAAELFTAAQKIDAAASVTAILMGTGDAMNNVCAEAAKIFPRVWKFDHSSLAYPNAEVVRQILVKSLPSHAIFLLPHDPFSMDLAPGLSIKLDAAYMADAVAIDGLDGTILRLVRQEYSGMAHTHIQCDVSGGLVLTLRPGVFQPEQEPSASGQVEDKSGEVDDVSVKRRFLEVVAAEAGDVDITKADILVSVGRGIEDQENIDLARELANAMGAVVSCSRPIVDAKWLEKARQVGTSGKTVSPNVYMALGISGSFQHLGGLKGSPFIVAVNKNPKAPIFQVADVGIMEDILEFIPALTEKVKG